MLQSNAYNNVILDQTKAMSDIKITLVRHGETCWNVEMRLQGMKDSELTENGLEQAHRVAEALRRNKFHAVFSSDLGRAVKTAEAINKYHKHSIQLVTSLRERNFGVMEGLTREEILEKLPDVHKAYMERKVEYPIPKGESLVQFNERVIKGLGSIARENEGKNILIVTHGGVLDCIMRMVFNYALDAPRRFSIYNGSISEFSVRSGEWFLEQWGNIDHQSTACISLDE
jgi:2,3-bisphosphoglycerate-dependent phosphoglycerate mutase